MPLGELTLRLAEAELPGHLKRDDGFLVARVKRRRVQLPWRALAPGDPGLPRAALVHELETDRGDTRARFLERLRASDAADLDEPFARPLAQAFHALFGGRGRTPDTDGFHRWALAIVLGDDPLAVRRVASHALIECDLPGVAEWFASADAPAWASEQHAAHREHVAMVASSRATADAGATTASLESDLDAALDIVDDERAWSRFRALASRARDRAVTYVDRILELWPDGELARIARTVARYDSVAAIHAHLDELGFRPLATASEVIEREIASGASEREIAEPLDVTQALAARRCSIAIDSETGHVPADHDALLYWLAELVPVELDFDQVPPTDDEAEPYTLRAYLDGQRWTAPARHLGDFYDVPSCVGLVNAVLAARDDRHRIALFDPPDQAVTLAAGPADGLRALRDAGVLAFGGQ